MSRMHYKLPAYGPLALRTAKERGSDKLDLSHACLGLISEVGELTSEIKRLTVYGRGMTPEVMGHIAEELGDICWYVPLACKAIGISIEESFDYFEAGGFSAQATPQNLEDSVMVLALAAVSIAACSLAGEDEWDTAWQEGKQMPAFVLISVQHMAGLFGLDFGEILDNNIAKLKLRYPEKYSDEAAELRADKGGLDARNS